MSSFWGDLQVVGFENGMPTVKTYEDRSMNFEQKKEAFVKPAVSAMMIPLQVSEVFLKNYGIKVGVGQIIEYGIDNIKEK